MMVDEFDDWVQQSGMLNDLMTTLNVTHIFNISMLTQEDEVKSGTHLRASVLEFTEMICRVCADASLPPPPTKGEDGEMIPSTMSVEERKAQPLVEKIRNSIPTMMESICDRKFLVKWNKNPLTLDPKKHMYLLENGKFF